MGYDQIDSEWIKHKMEKFGLKNVDLSNALEINPSTLTQWISGNRNPSGAAKAALYFYFENLYRTREMETVEKIDVYRGDWIKEDIDKVDESLQGLINNCEEAIQEIRLDGKSYYDSKGEEYEAIDYLDNLKLKLESVFDEFSEVYSDFYDSVYLKEESKENV